MEKNVLCSASCLLLCARDAMWKSISHCRLTKINSHVFHFSFHLLFGAGKSSHNFRTEVVWCRRHCHDLACEFAVNFQPFYGNFGWWRHFDRGRSCLLCKWDTLCHFIYIFHNNLFHSPLSLPFISKCFQSLRTYRRFGVVVVRTKAKRHIKRAVTFLDVRDFFKNCVLLADDSFYLHCLKMLLLPLKMHPSRVLGRRQRHLATVSHWSSSPASQQWSERAGSPRVDSKYSSYWMLKMAKMFTFLSS